MEIFELTSEQKKAFNRLKRAYKDCEKAGVFFVNRYGSLHAYDSKYIDSFGDDATGPASDSRVAVIETHGDINCMKIASEWCDDEGLHYYGLTNKGFKKLEED